MTTSLVDLCRQHSIDVDKLAQQTGLMQDRIVAILLGRWTPSPGERKSIADVFGVAPDSITWGHKTPIQHLYGHGPG